MLNSKGQIIAYDLMIGVAIFLILIAFMTSAWSKTLENASNERALDDMHLKAIEVADILTMTQGDPKNWENLADYNSVGLAADKRRLKWSKMKAFENADYNSLKEILHIVEFDFLIQVINPTDFNVLMSAGAERNTDFVIATQRVVTYNDEPVRLVVKIYS